MNNINISDSKQCNSTIHVKHRTVTQKNNKMPIKPLTAFL